MQAINKTVEAADATIIAVEKNSEGWVYGKTLESDGETEYVWRYDGDALEWMCGEDEVSYYYRVKTEETLEGMDLDFDEYDGPGLTSFCTGWDIDCNRCGYVGPMNIQKRKPTMDSETLHVCPECGLDNS